MTLPFLEAAIPPDPIPLQATPPPSYQPIFRSLLRFVLDAQVHLVVLEPGEPMAMYHWEADQEDFLVVAGEALLIAEGEERPLRQWDFVHCPPRTKHVIVGAGSSPCVVLAVGARGERSSGPEWGGYTVDEAALRHGAGADQETTDARVAYARVPKREPTRYRNGWLPD
jgi:uncharacterized cupin superfamily protein